MTLKAKVLQYMEQRTGLNVYTKDASRDLNISEQQFRSAINGLRNNNGMTSDLVIVTNSVYRYVPGAAKSTPTAEIFEQVGETKSGAIVIQNTNGDLFLAKALD